MAGCLASICLIRCFVNFSCLRCVIFVIFKLKEQFNYSFSSFKCVWQRWIISTFLLLSEYWIRISNNELLESWQWVDWCFFLRWFQYRFNIPVLSDAILLSLICRTNKVWLKSALEFLLKLFCFCFFCLFSKCLKIIFKFFAVEFLRLLNHSGWQKEGHPWFQLHNPALWRTHEILILSICKGEVLLEGLP